MAQLQQQRQATTDARAVLMPPPAARMPMHQQPIVLEEDEYMEKLEAIVQRDYFPDIPKLQNQLEWLRAVNSGDPLAIRQAQANIARRRAGVKTPLVAGTSRPGDSGTPGTWSTPGPATARRAQTSPSMTPLAPPHALRGPTVDSGITTPGGMHLSDVATPDPAASSQVAPLMSLDSFVSHYTSEDNASFATILEKNNACRRAKHAHHLEDKRPKLLTGAAANPTDEYGSGGQQPAALRMWKHVAKNQLYYSQPAQSLTDKELAECVQGPAKAIAVNETRMAPGTGFSESAAAAAGIIANLESQHFSAAPASSELMGGQQAGLLAGSTASGVAVAEARHGYLATPSFIPGVEASPFMTWGDIDSTPIRLDELDGLGPLGRPSGPGPNFKLPEVRNREQVGRTLAQRTGHSLLHHTAQRKSSQATPQLHHPALKRQRDSRERSAMLSPAAHKLILSHRSGANAFCPGSTLGGGSDAALRASYRGSARGATSTYSQFSTPQASARPVGGALATPVRVEAQKPSNSKAAAAAGQVSGLGGITDDLLKI